MTRQEYFEAIRKKKDEMLDVFPLDKSQWIVYSDFNDALNRLEQSYCRVDLVKGATSELP